MASYADMVAKYREDLDTPHLVTKPLCMVPAFYQAYTEARDALQRAELAASAITAPDGPRRKMNQISPVTEAKRRLEAAEQALSDVSLYLHFRVPSGSEHDKINTRLDKRLKTSRGTRGAEWNVAWLVEAFDHATTVSGERIDDFTADKIKTENGGWGPSVVEIELSKLTNPVVGDMIQSISRAMTMPDFPTLPK